MKKTLYNTVIILGLVSILMTGGCKVTFIPNYDSVIAEQIDQVAKETDKFFLTMLETTKVENDGRAFTNFAKDYVAIEVDLNVLLIKIK